MKRKRFTEELVIRILRVGEAVDNTLIVCHQHNNSE